MSEKAIPGGTVHPLPPDLQKSLTSNRSARTLWESLTPLARNEWICWIISVKKDDTRKEHSKRLVSELKEGKRRPYCWIGCVHRTDKKISPSVQAVLEGRLGKSKKKGA